MRSSLKPTTTISTQSTLTESDFERFTQFCFFATFQPQKFAEKAACLGRKTEISHIITHAIDHHGLIRCSQGNHDHRKYITVCQNDREVPSSTANCQKCCEIKTWKTEDFEDCEHIGNAICLRCWRSFTKRELNKHLKEPPCSYNAEQPKARKAMILYTTFCSDSKPPTLPPELPKQPPPEQSRKRKRRLELPPLRSAASPATTTPTTLTTRLNDDLVWPSSLSKMKIRFILDSYDGSWLPC